MSTKLALLPSVKSTTSSTQSVSARQFSTTSPRCIYVKNALRRVLPKDRSVIPNYPHGPSRWFKQSNKGLYGGLLIQHGNNVGEKFAVKTRRTWHPNIQPHTLYSRALGRPIRLRVATRVLRTIDKLGGLDEYLVGSSTAARIRELGMTGWALRWRVLQTRSMRRRFGITAQELDWLGQARRERGLMGKEGQEPLEAEEWEGLKGEGETVEEVAMDEMTKREVDAFDKILDEEDRKAESEEQRRGDALRNEDGKGETARDSESSWKGEEPEMIQERGGVMSRVKGMFQRK